MAENSNALGLSANTPESVKARIMAARLLQQSAASSSGPYTSGGITALKALSGLMGGLQERQAIDEAQRGQTAQRSMLAQLLMGGASPSAAAAGAASAPTPTGTALRGGAGSDTVASPGGHADFFGRLGHIESGNSDTASNKASGATGRYQFIASTWNRLAQQYPGLGLTPDGRTDPAQQQRAIQAFTNDNISSLGRAGFQATPGNLYLAHFAGAGGATAALKADPSTPVEQVLGGAAVRANSFLRGKTASDLVGWANGKMAGVDPSTVPGAPAAAKSAPAPAAAMASAAPSGTIGDGAALAAENRVRGGTGTDADRALLTTYRQQQNTPPADRVASADVPAANARPVASDTLPPGITPDMVSAPPRSPYGAMPSSMAQPPATADASTLGALLRGQAPGSGPGATPLPASVQPSSPFGAMPQSMSQPSPTPPAAPMMADAALPGPQGSPFGAGPKPMQGQGGSDPAMLAGLLRQGGRGQPVPGLTPAATGPSDPMDPRSNAFDYAMLPSGPRDQYAPAPETGGLGAAPAAPDLSAMLAPPDAASGAMLPDQGPVPPMGAQSQPGALLAAGAPDPTPPSSSPLAAALRQSAAEPTPSPSPGPMSAPSPTAPDVDQAAAPAPIAALGATPDPSDIAANATRAMAAAGMDVTGLPGMPQPSPAAPLPAMAAPNVPPPDLSGLAGPTTPPPGSGLPVFARSSSNPPAVLAQDLAGLGRDRSPAAVSSPEPSPRPDIQATANVPLPPPRPAGLNPDAPAPGAAQAGPAPAPRSMLAQAPARPQAQQPLGVPGNSQLSDPSSAVNFQRQEAARAGNGAPPSALGSLLRGQEPTAAAPSSPGAQAGGGPLDAIGRLFGMSGAPGSAGQGGGLSGMLSGLPNVGSMFGGQGGQQPGAGPNGQAAGSSSFGGQGQGQAFQPGGQGGQAGQEQASTIAGMDRTTAMQLLTSPYTSDAERTFILQRMNPTPTIEKTADGKIVSIDPRGNVPARVLYAGQGYRPATADERRSYGITDDRPFSFGPDGKPEIGTVDPNARETNEQRDYRQVAAEAQKAGQKAPSFADYQTSLRHAGSADPGPAGMVFGAMKEQREGAMAAAQALPSFQQANAAIKSGAILGAGADRRLDVAKTLSLFGYKDQGDATANTEVFRSAVAPVVLSTVKSLGSGSGISNADRDFAEKAAGGNINLEPQAIQRLLDIGERAANAKVAAYNATLDGTYPASDPKNAQVRQLFQLRMQDAGQPAGQAPGAPLPPAAAAPASAPVAAPAVPQGGGGQGGGYLPGAARGGAAASAQPSPIDAIAQARAAIASGAPRDAVMRRLQGMGINVQGM